jgi:hypothetical protein
LLEAVEVEVGLLQVAVAVVLEDYVQLLPQLVAVVL